MLFKGIKGSETGLWASAETKSHDDASMWRDIVGVDVNKATNGELFRVLEWGGMEVV